MKKILILGTGIMQIPAYRIAREMDWYSIGVDGNPDAMGVDLPDEFWHIDLKDRIALAEKAKEYKVAQGLDGVFTVGTDFSGSVAWVAEKLSLPGISYQTALDASDKFRMRSKLQQKGLPMPEFTLMVKGDDLANCGHIPFPKVVKPVDSMGARGVIMVKNMDELEAALEQAYSYSPTRRALVEGYIDGPEFSLDAVIHNGKIELFGIADRVISFSPCFIEKGHQFPSNFKEKEKKQIIQSFNDGIKALGIDNGAAKGDMKLSKDGPIIGEIAARLSGGFMSGWTYPYHSGRSAIKEAMKVSLGLEPDFENPSLNKSVVERGILSIPGVIKSLEKLDEAHGMTNVQDIFLLRDCGDDIRFPRNNVEKVGNVIAVADSFSECRGAAELAASKLVVRLEPNNERTAAYLKGWNSWPGLFYQGESTKISFLEDFTDMNFNCLHSLKFKGFITKPDFLDLSSSDWYNQSLEKGMEILKMEYSFHWGSGDLSTLDMHFWHALFRGGLQGARWFLDSLDA